MKHLNFRKAFKTVFLLFAYVIIILSCKLEDSGITEKTYTVGSVSFTMKYIRSVDDVTLGGGGLYYDNPEHQVSLSGYFIGETEVTQELWEVVMGVTNNPSFFDGSPGKEAAPGEVQSKRPVEQVSWYHAIAFCSKLSLELGLEPCYSVSGVDWQTLAFSSIPASINATWDAAAMDMSRNGFRLPTNAEWEWAAKGGRRDKWSGTNNKEEVINYVWYRNSDGGDSDNKTHEVGLKKPNGYGLYDMAGNVDEWCWNFEENLPSSGQDPVGPSLSIGDRALRGGFASNSSEDCSMVKQSWESPDNCLHFTGFRIVFRP